MGTDFALLRVSRHERVLDDALSGGGLRGDVCREKCGTGDSRWDWDCLPLGMDMSLGMGVGVGAAKRWVSVCWRSVD